MTVNQPTKRSAIGRVFSAFWSTLNFTRKLILNILFFAIIAAIIVAAGQDKGTVNIAQKSALVLNLSGVIVEQKQAVDPVDAFMAESLADDSTPQEILLADVLNVINNAEHDQRIQAIVLDLKYLAGGGLNKLEAIGKQLDSFKQAGKQVIAIGDYYTKSQYFLASYANEVLLHPMGFVQLDGFSMYNTYFKSALEKLKVSTYIFRVGSYKSAVEPFMRNDMSDEAKIANQAWLDQLWKLYKEGVAERRGLPTEAFDEKMADFETKFAAANYDMAQYSLENNWVDQLVTREEIDQKLAEIVGWTDNKRSYNKVSFKDYLSLVKPAQGFVQPAGDKVAIIVAKGTILDGHKKAGEIGGDSTAKLLERARLDDSVKAVVLRIDSPGGSAFASEVIRREIDLLQQANKPVVASMSSVAASGGYWIAASANEIWAHPSTVTGSIGVFGLYMTLENSLKHIGVQADGVSTTEWPVLNPAIPLEKSSQHILQKGTERVYQRFLHIVSKHRDMTLSEADQVAQGRIWIGTQAQQLGLVDKLGDLDDAIASAAKLAGVENFKTKVIEAELTPQQQLMKELLGQVSAWFEQPSDQSPYKFQPELVKTLKELKHLSQWNDPNGVYAFCEHCRF
ncbi:protease IV, a signal peptide peptidase [Catenovulum agarivorans DS-2]|uniref:Protease IV, a signal peptide peptidase n=1 Tax=Catenovulum agarivorans DS-2 TaxID=1328313 RepID=W7QT36_9ALTE|nr:signal peptide peptidase SppA [Catenovulum agarivorans]EWH08570.1 protease IV, a signal peptide peptidase [Catenovulum agarivorans DS-2]